MLKEGKLCYQAEAGNAAVQSGEPVPADSYLNRGEPLECSDTAKSRERFLQIAAEKGVKALLVIPLYRDRRFLGFLELQFEKPNSFHEGDVRAAQLLASLLVESFDFNRKTSPYSLSEEHENMLKLLQDLRPELERLETAGESPRLPQSEQSRPVPQITRADASCVCKKDGVVSENTITCRSCGNVLVAGEVFCGICGTARLEKPAHENIQHKSAPLSSKQPPREANPIGDQAQSEPLPTKTRSSSPPSFEQFLSEVAASQQPEPFMHPNSKSTNDFGRLNLLRNDADSAFSPDSTPQDHGELLEPERQDLDEDGALGQTEPSTATESVLQELAEPASTALVPLRIIPTGALPNSEGIQLAPWKSAGRARQWLKLGGITEASKKEWAQRLWKRHRAIHAGRRDRLGAHMAGARRLTSRFLKSCSLLWVSPSPLRCPPFLATLTVRFGLTSILPFITALAPSCMEKPQVAVLPPKKMPSRTSLNPPVAKPASNLEHLQ